METNSNERIINLGGLSHFKDKMDAEIDKKIENSIPDSLPALGGDADTVGGKSPSDFIQHTSRINLVEVQESIPNGSDVLAWMIENGKTGRLYAGEGGWEYTNVPDSGIGLNAWRWYIWGNGGIDLICMEQTSGAIYYNRYVITAEGNEWYGWKKINDGGNANTVNSHTVDTDVPANAVFSDTVYDDTEIRSIIDRKVNKPVKPTCVRATPFGNGCSVNWEYVEGATEYAVGCKLYGTTEFVQNHGSITTNFFALYNLINGSTYDILVQAKVNGVWNEYDPNDLIQVTPLQSCTLHSGTAMAVDANLPEGDLYGQY